MHSSWTLIGAPRKLRADCSGVTMLEYAIMGSIIAGMLVVSVPPITAAVMANLTQIAAEISTD